MPSITLGSFFSLYWAVHFQRTGRTTSREREHTDEHACAGAPRGGGRCEEWRSTVEESVGPGQRSERGEERRSREWSGSSGSGGPLPGDAVRKRSGALTLASG